MLVPPVAGGSTLTLRFILENGTGAVKVFEKAKATTFSFESGMVYHFNQSNTFNGTAMLYGSDAVTAETMDGTAEHPYLVYSGNSWNVLKTNSIMGAEGKQINLAEDINVNSTYTSEFKATLNGNGHTITLTTPNISLLSSINGGQVRNVTIESTEPVRHPILVYNDPARYYGALAGRAFSSAVFENCVNKVNITCDTLNYATVYVGGLIGNANGCTMTNCRNEGNITSNAAYVGGVAGQAGAISDCTNSGTITITTTADVVKTSYCGGVAGYVVSADVSNCYNTGAININTKSSEISYYGGVFGLANSNVSNCSNRAAISCNVVSDTKNKYVGGVVGYNNSSSAVTMLNCYNEGDILCESGAKYLYVGGLLAYDSRMSIKNSYAFCSLQGTYVCGIVAYGAGLFINANITNCYYYGTITCSSSNKYGIAGVSNNDNKFNIYKCYYPSAYNICYPNSTNDSTSVTLSSAVSLTGGDGTSLRDTLNRNVSNIPVSGACTWKNGTSPARVVFDN